jgi:positive regulator of sigma E activity
MVLAFVIGFVLATVLAYVFAYAFPILFLATLPLWRWLGSLVDAHPFIALAALAVAFVFLGRYSRAYEAKHRSKITPEELIAGMQRIIGPREQD